MAKIEAWLESHGYTLEPSNHYACHWETKVILYRQHDRPDTVIGGLLHECGHVLVSEAIKRPSATVRYKRGYPSRLTGRARPNISAADLVHEEIEAWHRGHALARRLGIKLNERAFWRDYGYCIKRYFRRMLDRRW